MHINYFCIMDRVSINRMIEEYSRELGFCAYGSAQYAKLDSDMEYLKTYLSKGFNGDMNYLERNADKRHDPALLMEGTKSILCFLAQYNRAPEFPKDYPRVASYATGEDYHEVLRGKLHMIAGRIKEYLPGMRYRAFTDSAPLFERSWARRSGLGFVGKNTMLINKEFGVRTFIGIIITDADLSVKKEEIASACGSCKRCIEACPTGALSEEYVLDARRCISYLTIESRRKRSEEPFNPDTRGYIFGCDICIDACPWSRKGNVSPITEFVPVVERVVRSRGEWLEMDNSRFDSLFSGTPFMRAGLDKIKDNITADGIQNQSRG